jgi:hypothetical protein
MVVVFYQLQNVHQIVVEHLFLLACLIGLINCDNWVYDNIVEGSMLKNDLNNIIRFSDIDDANELLLVVLDDSGTDIDDNICDIFRFVVFFDGIEIEFNDGVGRSKESMACCNVDIGAADADMV